MNWPVFVLGAIGAWSALHAIGLLRCGRSFWAGFEIDRNSNPVKFWVFIAFDVSILVFSLVFAARFS